MGMGIFMPDMHEMRFLLLALGSSDMSTSLYSEFPVNESSPEISCHVMSYHDMSSPQSDNSVSKISDVCVVS